MPVPSMTDDKLLELADNFERRALWILTREGEHICNEDGLWILSGDVAHAAHCFTVANGLRSLANKETEK